MFIFFARRKILCTFEEKNLVPLHFQAGRGSFHRKFPMPLRRSPRETLQFCILRQFDLVLRLLRNILGSFKFFLVSGNVVKLQRFRHRYCTRKERLRAYTDAAFELVVEA